MLAQGFADPVFDSQHAFRGIMEALANPGQQRTLDVLPEVPAGLPRAAAAVLLALCDFETPVYLSPSLQALPAVGDYIRFHTGAELTEQPAKSLFSVVAPSEDGLFYEHFAQGTADYPDRSTTVIVLCSALDGGPEIRLAGPGIRTTTTIAPQGLPDDFCARMAANRAQFPLGVDVILASQNNILALPRSTRLTPGER